MQVWITGIAGFVGPWLAERLRADGHGVGGADLELDVCNGAAVEAVVAEQRPDAIVHLAAQSSVATSTRAPEATARVNLLGSLSVLRAAARRAPRARVLLVGTGEVYGPCDGPDRRHDEDAPLLPGTPYARSKAAADLLGADFARRGLDVVRVRPFNHTGPGQGDTFVASSFARQVAEIEAGVRAPELAVGNLDAVRDFSDVRDVVDAYRLLLDPSTPAGAYNVASGTGVSAGEILDTLLDLAGVRATIRTDPARWRPARPAVGNAGRLAAATGWTPRIPLRQTLADLLDDWRARIRTAG